MPQVTDNNKAMLTKKLALTKNARPILEMVYTEFNDISLNIFYNNPCTVKEITDDKTLKNIHSDEAANLIGWFHV